MTVKQIIPTHYEFETTDDKPTGVLPITTLRDILTNAMYITYDGGENWIVADKRVRLVGEDGSFLALDEQLDDLLANIAILEHHRHSRSRVYPQNVGTVATLIAAAVADTFGDWIEIVPINTIDFIYEVEGLVAETANVSTTYFVQMGFSLVAVTEPTEAQIMGERRFPLTNPISKATEVISFKSQNCPTNAKLWGRLKTASGGADQLGISIVVQRHIEITNSVTKLATWPWSI